METEVIMPANPTKTATILKLLRRPKGTSIAQLQKATDWQEAARLGLVSKKRAFANADRGQP